MSLSFGDSIIKPIFGDSNISKAYFGNDIVFRKDNIVKPDDFYLKLFAFNDIPTGTLFRCLPKNKVYAVELSSASPFIHGIIKVYNLGDISSVEKVSLNAGLSVETYSFSVLSNPFSIAPVPMIIREEGDEIKLMISGLLEEAGSVFAREIIVTYNKKLGTASPQYWGGLSHKRLERFAGRMELLGETVYVYNKEIYCFDHNLTLVELPVSIYENLANSCWGRVKAFNVDYKEFLVTHSENSIIIYSVKYDDNYDIKLSKINTYTSNLERSLSLTVFGDKVHLFAMERYQIGTYPRGWLLEFNGTNFTTLAQVSTANNKGIPWGNSTHEESYISGIFMQQFGIVVYAVKNQCVVEDINTGANRSVFYINSTTYQVFESENKIIFNEGYYDCILSEFISVPFNSYNTEALKFSSYKVLDPMFDLYIAGNYTLTEKLNGMPNAADGTKLSDYVIYNRNSQPALSSNYLTKSEKNNLLSYINMESTDLKHLRMIALYSYFGINRVTIL